MSHFEYDCLLSTLTFNSLSPASMRDINLRAQAPPFLTSTPRLVQDQRALNESVIVKTVNLNPINTRLENIASQRARYFTVVDLKNAFWSVQLSPELRPYTSFVDPLTYARKQWCVTPMGYVNSSAALHTVINHVLSEPVIFSLTIIITRTIMNGLSSR